MDDSTLHYHGGNPYSTKAHRNTDKNRDLFRLYRLLHERYPGGLTSDEAEVLTGMLHQTCSARFTDMKRYFWIEHCGTRPTRTGNLAGVWRVIKDEDQQGEQT
jgi:hypothetical protein